MALATIEEAIEDIKAGKFVIVVDDEDRENEGDLIMDGRAIFQEETRVIKENHGLTNLVTRRQGIHPPA